MALGSCSINLGSLTPSSEPSEPARSTSSINIASLSEVIKNSPNDPAAYNKRGSALAQAGKTDEALADFNKAISLDANYGPAYANRGLIYRQTRRLDLAMADFERAIALDANSAPAYLGRGLVRKAGNQTAEALEDFNKAIALAPDNADAYYNRGLLHQHEKQYQSAIDDFTAASGLVPQQAEPLLARALSYLALDARRRVPALSASAASPARATMRSDSYAVRSEATARQSANCWRPPFPFCSCSLPGKTAWNIDLAAANTSWATVFACEAALAASAAPPASAFVAAPFSAAALTWLNASMSNSWEPLPP